MPNLFAVAVIFSMAAVFTPKVLLSQARLPRLSVAFVTKSIDDAPVDSRRVIRVSESGSIVFVPAPGDGGQLAFAEKTGTVRRFGKQGSGPGELESADPIDANSRGFFVWDSKLRRVTSWNTRGEFINAQQVPGTVRPVSLTTDGFFGLDKVAGSWRPFLIQPTGQARELLEKGEVLFDASQVRVAGKPLVSPVFGHWSDGFLVANPMTYEIMFYSWAGKKTGHASRTLPPELPTTTRVNEFLQTIPGFAQRSAAEQGAFRQQAATMELPLIAAGGSPTTDSKGRLWILGPAADSAYADVFAGTDFLGRVPVPCRGFQGASHVKGQWLAVACQPDDKKFDGDAVLKLFRIEG